MSKLKALITTLVLGSSSLAVADSTVFQTKLGWDHRDDHEHGEDRVDARRARRWVALGLPVHSGGKDVIPLDERMDDIAALQVRATFGATYVYSLLIHFEDGSHERLSLGRWVYAGAPIAQVKLPKDRGGVVQIDVTSWAGRTNAKIQLLGQRMRARPGRPMPPLPPLPDAPPIYQPGGIVLGTNISFANTNGFRYLPVGAARGRFTTLRLEGVAGRTPIAKVRVDFVDGRSQTFANLGRVLTRGQTIELSLEAARPIANVLVVMDEDLRPVGPSSGTIALRAF